MKQRGKRIRPSGKDLVFHFTIASLLPVFLLVVGLFHVKTIQQINWQDFNLSQADKIDIPYLIISFSVAILICLLVAFVFKRVRYDTVKQLYHRQKLAKMILENKWYESEQVKTEGFFKDSAGRTKEKITYFPKMYYRLKNGLIQIRVEITLGKYQDQLLHLEKKLESGLYCELTDKELKDSYVEYTLLYDTIASRISIDEVEAKDGKLRLMKNVWWEYDKLPHMLIAGGTGGGKTYFILTLIEALLHTDSKLYILDPKNADLADLGSVMANVYYRKEDLLSCIETFYEEMMKRSEEMKQMKNYKTGKNYAYLGLPAHFLIFDEYVAFMEMLGTKENTAVMNKLKQIVMLGRQAGFFLILACQRPDAKYLGDGIRDQFNFRVALGRMSEMGYGMMFGSDVQKDFFLKRIKGRGYVDVGTSVISEFYTPLVPNIRFQNCSLFPLYHGSAKSNIGIDNLIEVITNKFCSSTHRGPSELCGNVFKIEYTKKRQRLAYIRLFWLQGIYKISAYVKWALKVDIRLFDWRDFY
ncbi:cell division protein FtsK [Enterococcus faecium]|nr:cell division protein FtsK [Enterococcus faecium]